MSFDWGAQNQREISLKALQDNNAERAAALDVSRTRNAQIIADMKKAHADKLAAAKEKTAATMKERVDYTALAAALKPNEQLASAVLKACQQLQHGIQALQEIAARKSFTTMEVKRDHDGKITGATFDK